MTRNSQRTSQNHQNLDQKNHGVPDWALIQATLHMKLESIDADRAMTKNS